MAVNIKKINEEDYERIFVMTDLHGCYDLFTKIMDEINFTKKEGSLSFQVPVNKSQQLSVILTLPAPSDCQNGYYHITQWTTEATESWDGDDSYQLFSPVDS